MTQSNREQFIYSDTCVTPFGPIFSTCQNQLPYAFREQFLMPVDAPFNIMLEGQMAQVWHRPGWLKPFFWILAWFDMLFPETGSNIPASMVIKGGYNQWQEPYHLWDRTFSFSIPRHFNAMMAFNPTANCVVELLGPQGFLEMQWDIHFMPPVTIEIVTSGCSIRIGRSRISLPQFAYPIVHAVETITDEEQNKICVNLTVTHVWLGKIFGYNGTFQIRRIYAQENR